MSDVTQHTIDAVPRLAEPADGPRIAALMRASVEAIFPSIYDAAQTSSVVVHLAACGGWSRLLDPATEPARVRAMFVHANWTRRGLGTVILTACEDADRAQGFTELALMATLPGVPLYRSWGFGDEEPQQLPMPEVVAHSAEASRAGVGQPVIVRRIATPPRTTPSG